MFQDIKALYLSGDVGNHPCYCIIPRLHKTQRCIGRPYQVGIIYVFSSADNFTAGLLTGWLILVSLLDNFLEPILLGRGAPVPMLVIFLGAIGGCPAMGFLGLFVGAVILSIGFKLFRVWLDDLSHPNTTGGPDDFSSEKSKTVS